MRSRFPLRGMAVAWRTGGAVEAAETAVRTSRRPRSTDRPPGAGVCRCLRATLDAGSGCHCYRVACVTLLDFSSGDWEEAAF